LHPLDNGEIFGLNQENAAYPSGLCAERVAIFHAGAIYPTAKILKMASQQLRIPTKLLPYSALWFLQTIYCRV
jgi:cytidine deaminase